MALSVAQKKYLKTHTVSRMKKATAKGALGKTSNVKAVSKAVGTKSTSSSSGSKYFSSTGKARQAIEQKKVGTSYGRSKSSTTDYKEVGKSLGTQKTSQLIGELRQKGILAAGAMPTVEQLGRYASEGIFKSAKSENVKLRQQGGTYTPTPTKQPTTTTEQTTVQPEQPVTEDITKGGLSPDYYQELYGTPEGAPETGLTGFQKTIDDLGAIFAGFRNDLFSSLGNMGQTVQDSIANIEAETGGIINTSDVNLQRELQGLQPGQDPNEVLKKYILAPDAKLPVGQSIEEIGKTIAPDLPPEEQKDKAERYLNTMLANSTRRYQPGGFKPQYMDYGQAMAEGAQGSPTTPPPGQEAYTAPTTEPVTGYDDESYYDQQQPEMQVAEYIGNELSGQNAGSAMNMMMNFDSANMTSAQIIDATLMQNLGFIGNDQMSQYFDLLTEHALQGYEQGMADVKAGLTDIDKAISSPDFTPSTYEGLMAKIYTQEKEYQQEAIGIEKDYLKEQHDVQMSLEREKRGRLEGYLKAKLVGMGAQDSSAGLMVMSTQVNQADMRLQLMEADYTHSIASLNLESRKIQSSFTNNIAQLTMETEAKEAEAASKLDEKLLEITGMRIEDEQEKQKLRMDAMNTWSEKSVELKKYQQDMAFKQYQQSYKETQDAIDNTFKLSGVTGEIYTLDENGNAVSTGIPTFEAGKWQDSYQLDLWQAERTQDNDLVNQAFDLLDRYGTAASGAIEQAFGMPEGTLSQYQTIDEQKLAYDYWAKNLNYSLDLQKYNDEQSATSEFMSNFTGDTLSLSSSNISDLYADGAYGGQCGEFCHQIVTDYPYGLNLLSEKLNAANLSSAYIANNARPGDLIFTNEGGQWGHVACIGKINPDRTATLVESNFGLNERITTYRTIPLNSDKIKGGFRGTLNPSIQVQQQTVDISNTNLDTSISDIGETYEIFDNTIKGIIDIMPDSLKSQYNIEDIFTIKGAMDLNELQNLYADKVGVSDYMIEKFNKYADGDKAYYNNLSNVEQKVFLDNYYSWENVVGKLLTEEKETATQGEKEEETGMVFFK